MKRAVVVCIIGTAQFLGPAPIQAQQSAEQVQDGPMRAVALVQARSEMDRAEAQYRRYHQLYERGLVSRQEMEHHQGAWERTRTDYVRAALSASSAPRLMIERATSRRGADGRRYLRLLLRSAGGVGLGAEAAARSLDPELVNLLRGGQLRDVYVSIKGDAGPTGTIISAPFERRIARLAAGQTIELSFEMLREADEVVVSVTHGGATEERRVFVEPDASAEMVGIHSVQFSQEADLGANATYDLALERFTRTADAFRLVVVGLPPEVRAEFRDPDGGARLNQIRFPEGQNQKRLQLLVSLPRRASGGLRAEQAIPFWALVLDEEEYSRLPAGAASPEGLRGGRTRLELVPRGVGQIEVQAAKLFYQIAGGDSVLMEVSVRNVGTQPLRGVRLRVDAPQGWTSRSPLAAVDDVLPPDAERVLQIILRPPKDAVVGDYEARLRTESAAADRRLESEDKTVRIQLVSGQNWLATGVVSLLLIATIAGVVMAGIRLVRR